jgi:hypothetical protein
LTVPKKVPAIIMNVSLREEEVVRFLVIKALSKVSKKLSYKFTFPKIINT